MKSARADRIAIRTSFALLCERVHKVWYVRMMAREEIAVVSEKLKVSVNEGRWLKLDRWSTEAGEKAFKQTRERHIAKLDKLIGKPDNGRRNQRKLVVNLSKKLLDEHQTRVLEYGLNFAIAPSRIPIKEIVLSTESLSRRLDSHRY